MSGQGVVKASAQGVGRVLGQGVGTRRGQRRRHKAWSMASAQGVDCFFLFSYLKNKK
jgi:hypothetical protein